MNKKILISLSVIGVVAAIAIGGTIAFFSDTETSTGNTFTAGSLDLLVDSHCTYNSQTSDQCGTWELKNLVPNVDKFFNFADVKPGDSGENTISLHVDNAAWLRLVVSAVTDNDNTQTEPESLVDADGLTSGELRENLLFTVFTDANCNNIEDGTDVTLISEGTIDAQGEIWALPTSLPDDTTTCFGIAWRLPTTVGNEVQSDSMSATMELQVQQYRNNPTPVW